MPLELTFVLCLQVQRKAKALAAYQAEPVSKQAICLRGWQGPLEGWTWRMQLACSRISGSCHTLLLYMTCDPILLCKSYDSACWAQTSQLRFKLHNNAARCAPLPMSVITDPALRCGSVCQAWCAASPRCRSEDRGIRLKLAKQKQETHTVHVHRNHTIVTATHPAALCPRYALASHCSSGRNTL